jgi:hypothetical protein
MQSDSETDRAIYQLISEKLSTIGERVYVSDQGVRFAEWPTIRLFRRLLGVQQARGVAINWIAQLEMIFQYNAAMPETAVLSRAVGLGPTPDDAFSNAVQNWTSGIAPPLISYIYGFLKYGADYAPDGDVLGIPGWDCICGPYVLHGAEAVRVAAEQSLLQLPLISQCRTSLPSD